MPVITSAAVEAAVNGVRMGGVTVTVFPSSDRVDHLVEERVDHLVEELGGRGTGR
jgi:copper(I)-binding protein